MDLPTGTTPAVPAETVLTISPEPKRPGVWSGLGIVALYFLLQFGLGMLIGMLIGVALGVEAGIRSAHVHRKLDPGAIVRTLQHGPDTGVILTVLTLAAAATVMALIVRHTWPAQWSRAELPGFAFTQPDSKLAYLGAVVLGVGISLLGGGMTELFAGSHPLQQDIAVMAASAPTGLRVLLALAGIGVAPFVEELVFRGVLLSGLASRMRVGWAIIVSALIFGCAHLPDFKFAWYAIPALVLLGLVLGWLRVKTRSLWPSITLHASYNSVAVLAWFMVAQH